MGLYVTRCTLEINGQSISDFKHFSEKTRAVRKQVPLMYKTGHAQLTQRYQVEVDYVMPQIGPFEFDGISGGTLTVEFDGGERIDYGGVYTLDVGDAVLDGENEVVRKIALGCESRSGNVGADVSPAAEGFVMLS